MTTAGDAAGRNGRYPTVPTPGRMVRAENADAEVSFERDALGWILTETCNGLHSQHGLARLPRTPDSLDTDARGEREYSGTARAWLQASV